MDKKTSGMIKRDLKIKGLLIEYHHASWRDGGLSYPSLRNKGGVLTIRSFAQITLSDDMGVRATMRYFIEEEREFRRIDTDPNAQFLDRKEGKGTSTETSPIIENARRESKN
jgi:hypothetical protein